MRWLDGVVYRVKRSGPKTEPFGTPQDSGRGCEQWLEALTENDLEDKYDWNQTIEQCQRRQTKRTVVGEGWCDQWCRMQRRCRGGRGRKFADG